MGRISNIGGGASAGGLTTTTGDLRYQHLYNVKNYGAIGDGVTNDQAAIQAAIAALPTNGGIVFFPSGTYKVSSTKRVDAVSVSGTTVTDASCIAGDVGSYCIGVGVNGRIPKILTVNPGVSFTIDFALGGAPTSLTIVSPGLVLPENVQIWGEGAAYTNNGFGAGNASASKILDFGTGITILTRGGGAVTGNAASRYKLKDISVWSNANTTLYGVYIANMAWFFSAENCDFSYHGVAGVAIDGNMNTDDFTNCNFLGNGTVGAAGFTGGVLTNVTWDQPSAGVNFYNCFFNANYGFGLANAQGNGSYGIHLYGCQQNNTIASAKVGSGVSLWLANVGNGQSSIYGGWSESAALYDIITNGPVVVEAFRLYSSTAYGWDVFGNAVAIGCWFANHSTSSVKIESGGNISWMDLNISDPFFSSGLPANSVMFGMGSSNAIAGAGTGMSPGSFGQSTTNTIWQGSGVPGAGNGGNGDIYFRTDGAAGTRLYFKASGAWSTLSSGDVGLGNVDNTSDATKNAAAVTLTNKTITTPLGIVKGDVGLGNVDNTSNATERAATATLTNKRVTRRAPAVTQSATPIINTDNTDVAHITGLAQAITSMTTNLTGTPVEGDMLRIDITDNGTARAITWGTSFEASGTVALPTTTVLGVRLDVGFVWNTVTTKWRCVATA